MVSEGQTQKGVLPLDLVNLTRLMEVSRGRSAMVVGLIDGPVATDHHDLAGAIIRELPGRTNGSCVASNSAACMHGTFVAGIIVAKRGSLAPAICPNCTLLLRPIFAETTEGRELMHGATPDELASAMIDCINAGARLSNLSVALAPQLSTKRGPLLEALDYAVKRDVM